MRKIALRDHTLVCHLLQLHQTQAVDELPSPAAGLRSLGGGGDLGQGGGVFAGFLKIITAIRVRGGGILENFATRFHRFPTQELAALGLRVAGAS